MKSLAKSLLRLLALIAVSPALLVHVFKVPFLGRDRAVLGSTELLSLVPGVLGEYLRRALLMQIVRECHPSVSIGFGTTFSKWDLSIAEHVYIGARCNIGTARIGKDVLLASGVFITSGGKMHGTDDPDTPIREQEGVFTAVSIGAGCWVGSCAVIMADVGDHTVIGAGAVVTKPIPALGRRRRRARESHPRAGEGMIPFLLPADEPKTPGEPALLTFSRRAMATEFTLMTPPSPLLASWAASDALDRIDDSRTTPDRLPY